jgi:hypothetical protein
MKFFSHRGYLYFFEALHGQYFFVIWWEYLGDNFLSATRAYNFIGFWMP